MSCNHCSEIFGLVAALLVAAVLSIGAAAQAHSAQFKVIHSFNGASTDAYPDAGLVLDAAGNLYGTTAGDSIHGHGSVFKLTPSTRTAAGPKARFTPSAAAWTDGDP